jgi:hypothetical protein
MSRHTGPFLEIAAMLTPSALKVKPMELNPRFMNKAKSARQPPSEQQRNIVSHFARVSRFTK